MTLNELVCKFDPYTPIHVHIRFADDKETEKNWYKDFGVWDGTYYGITRYEVGSLEVESINVTPLRFNQKEKVHITAYEKNYSEKLKALMKEREET